MSCRIEPYVIPSAKIKDENPLPDIKNNSYIHAKIETTDNVDPEIRKCIGKGMINTMLPYCMQDDYTRERVDKVYSAVVLENKYLKAVFIPELGARLWSLYDKEHKKELLYRNPVYQPCNLALRNAWFSGGVEFNIGIKGHTPLTCSNYFASKITMEDGSEGVRFYEYERIRAVAYGFDCWLPEDSKMLYIRPRIENKTGREIWMYWWSNIAVPLTKETRVIVPAQRYFKNFYSNDHYVLDFESFPNTLDIDASYPSNVKRSLDFFFKIPQENKKWITALDKDGTGLVQCSTKLLKGRKLFVWGNGRGGNNWQKFLSDGKNDGYIEIQAGLAHTQLEHIPMEDGAIWSWTEAYGYMSADKTKVHGEWNESIAVVENQLENIFNGNMTAELEKQHSKKAVVGEMLFGGSGWGALENARRLRDGEQPLSDTFKFPMESIDEKQLEWLLLLEKGNLLKHDVNDAPRSYLVDKVWMDKLDNALKDAENRHWYSLMQAGVMHYANGDIDGAIKLFEQSLEHDENAWANRNLAMIYKNELDDKEKAFEYMMKAVNQAKDTRSVVIDFAVTCIGVGKYTEWLDVYGSLSESLKEDGRIKYYYVLANYELKRYKEAAAVFKPGSVINDIKEGDTRISELWYNLYQKIVEIETGETDSEKVKAITEEKYPIGELEFRMNI